MFSIHIRPEEFKKVTIAGHYMHLFLRKTRSGKSYDYRGAIVFEKRRFRDGLVWSVGLTVEIKSRFQISLAQSGRGLKLCSFGVKHF